MKRYITVTALWLRRCLAPLALLLAALYAADTALFLRALRRHADMALENVLYYSGIGKLAAAAFLLLCAWLFFIGGEHSARQSYTLRRLSVTPLGGFCARWAACTACFVILWGGQTAIVLWLCRLYEKLGPSELCGAQTVLLASYRSSFFHALLPLHETVMWVRNAVTCLALGASAARMPARRRGFVALYCLAPLTVFWFRWALGGYFLPGVIILLNAGEIVWELVLAAARRKEKGDAAQTP